MKKLIALGMAATMTVGLLTGCGSSSSTPTADTKAESRAATGSSKTADLAVGTIASASDAQSCNDDVLADLELAEQELGIKGIPLEVPEISDSANSIRTLISQGITFIMVSSSEYKDGMLEVTAENPDVKLLYLAGAIDGADNIMSVAYHEDEAAFLGGALADMITKTNNIDVVMAVSKALQYHHQFDFSAGVKVVNPDCEVQSAFTNGCTDVGQGNEVAKVMYNKDTDLIGTYVDACSPGVFNAAKDVGDGKYCLGATDEQFDKMPDKIVASVVKLADQTILSIIKGYMETDEFDTSEPMSLGLKEGGVRLLFTNSDELLKTILEDVMSAVKDLTAKMESGEIKVLADKGEFSSFTYSYTKQATTVDGDGTTMGSIIQLKEVTKQFPGIVASNHISIDIEEGEIRTFAGENRAGKSTLMNILYGLYQPDKGELLIRREPIHFTSSRYSIHHKIGMVHQHFMLIPRLTVTENITVGQEAGTALKVDRAGAGQKIKTLSEQYGLKIGLDKKVSELSVTRQQGVGILKVLYRKTEILIFDKPTAVLTPQEIKEFCDILLKLRERRKTIVFVNHKPAEVMKISGRITAIRLGRVVGTVDKSRTNPEDLTKMMVDRDVNLGGRERRQAKKIENVLGMKDMNYMVNKMVKKLNHINLEPKGGEMLGIASVDGNDQEELVNVTCGKIKPDGDSVIMNGQGITREKVRTRRDGGLDLIPEGRRRDDPVLEYGIANNLILGCQYQELYTKKNVRLNLKRTYETAETLKERFDIRCADAGVNAGTLSGGSRQKIIIAREAYHNPDVLVAVRPARGLGMGAMEFVQKTLPEQRGQGKGVLLFSLELDEILSVSDKIAVIFKEEIIDIMDTESVIRQGLSMVTLGSSKGKGGAAVGTVG